MSSPKTTRKIRHICFDLDGTLVDSFNTIFNTTVKTLRILNFKGSVSENDFRVRIGHHFKDIFRDLNIKVNDIENFISIYKKHYFDFIDQSVLYPSVIKTLDMVNQRDILISLLTTKTQDQAEKIIRYFNLSEHFDFIMGRRDGMRVKPHPEPLLAICKELKVSAAETLMVGDTELDIECGRSAGSATCAVLYGYRERENLFKENADFYIDSIADLTDLLD